MKFKLLITSFFESPFHSNKQVFLVMAIVSYILLGLDPYWGFFGAVNAPNFIPAYLFTLGVCLLLTIYLHAVNKWFSIHYQDKYTTKKSLAYFFYGVLIPVSFEILAVELFFREKGESVVTNTFFKIDFILVVIYILLVNAYYAYANHNLKVKLRIRATLKNRVIPALKDLQLLKALHRLDLMEKAPVSLLSFDLKAIQIDETQIACAYKIDGLIEVHHFNQTVEISHVPISKILASQNQEEYVKINPSCFYHRLLIFSYEELAPSRRIYLRLRHPFNHLIHEQQRIVSQSLSVNFKKKVKF